MNGFVLDTSVAIAWYLPETFTPAARVWQQKLLASQVELVVPGLHYWEFANVMRTYVRRGELAEDLAHEAYAAHLEAPLTTVEPGRSGILACALEYDATVYDAVYIRLALAATRACSRRSDRPHPGQ
ncbi:MAG TPA: PIN domain nuclease [Candidatus Latescibacteria bacterium]|nr:PIN domain nuclease [Candidatus Latescibacterota bacterium]